MGVWNELVPNAMTLLALAVGLVGLVVTLVVKRRKYVKRIDLVPGMPGGSTILGNALLLMVPPSAVFRMIIGYIVSYRAMGPVLRVWIGPFPMFMLYTAEGAEALLSSTRLIGKSREYDFLHSWLGTGLLTSTGTKWFHRRKLLTPTFHLKILADFVHVFNEQSRILVDKLDQAINESEQGFNIYPFITRCTLDIICESSMGRNVNAQSQSDSDYVQAVYMMSSIVQKRQIRPWLQPEPFFQLSSLGAEQRRCLKILHDFTDNVIKEKKIEHKEKRNAINDDHKEKDDDMATNKKRLAFLDLLIEASEDGKVLSDKDIREEVDTFMFEGHDTTSAAIDWALLLIGSNSEVQERVHEELDRVFGDSDRPITLADLSDLKYLELCIKETLRLYPSVPFMGRQITEDVTIHGYELPAGSSVLMLTYMLHRDPKFFPNPEVFDPERFTAENMRGRHPYAYVPFSAGPRNCIGQKFALMEEKVVLASVLRRFHVEALDKREELVLLGELILRPRDGVNLRLTRRQKRC